MTLVARERGDDARDGLVEIRGLVHDDRVLPAHLRNHPLDGPRPRPHACIGLSQNLKPHVLGSSERDDLDQWMSDQGPADLRPSGHELERAVWNSRGGQ